MNFSSSLLEALVGGVFVSVFLPPGIMKGMANAVPRVAMDSYIWSVPGWIATQRPTGIQSMGVAAWCTYPV